jgi:hypothetical protein
MRRLGWNYGPSPVITGYGGSAYGIIAMAGDGGDVIQGDVIQGDIININHIREYLPSIVLDVILNRVCAFPEGTDDSGRKDSPFFILSVEHLLTQSLPQITQGFWNLYLAPNMRHMTPRGQILEIRALETLGRQYWKKLIFGLRIRFPILHQYSG